MPRRELFELNDTTLHISCQLCYNIFVHRPKREKRHEKTSHKKHPKEGTKKNQKPIRGVITVTLKGPGFLVRPDSPDDIFIPPEHLETALNGDVVEVVVTQEAREKRRATGRVIRVIERVKTRFVGTLMKERQGVFLKPDDRKMYAPPLITNPPRVLTEGSKGLVELLSWKSPAEPPKGKLITIIGRGGEHETEMRSIVLGRGFEDSFDPQIEREAKALHANREISVSEIAKRRDFRNTPTCTIDPENAQDFDDALSFKKLGNEEYEVGVHIADVSHYVRIGSAIDKEAQKRGTSIYLVDRTIPMLPEVLSNDVCSLNPNEDKLTYSAVFTLTKTGAVTNRWFGKTIIHSHKRFTYEEAQTVIDGSTESDFTEALQTLNALSKRIRDKRFEYGAIDFDQPEVRFRLNDSGKPVEVVRKERLEAHKLIEEFMLLANREVATYVARLSKKAPDLQRAFIYRIHDTPDPERIEDLSIFLRALGYELKENRGIVTAKELNRVLKEISGTPEESLIKTATIRSMAKAVYSTKNIGHFGLAFAYYTHFTSPIRRYPDIMVHRLLFEHLAHGNGTDTPLSPHEVQAYEALAVHSSEREVAAADAERDSIKFKQAEYLVGRVGEVFEGTISGVTEWGMYVSEKNTLAEGLVRIQTLTDDTYELDQENYALVGARSKRRYRLGDGVKVRLLRASPSERTIDFELVLP
jgi:ribonuclease R